ncbi:altronate hydrolase [Paraburkholderia fungorum]|uniref:Altronate hydrolase n=1 Tax=Paraburkholderia fungorum TaxID=134537 RepID=A0A1H1JNR2_9BURK|nr:altronate dehydratase family protein [Paraburkholderia fungorum]SDR51651.1 altronate hydrolase [Paraburkholderia fungorum]
MQDVIEQVSPVIRLHAADTVGIARTAITKGALLEPYGIVAQQDIPAGHKLALHAVPKGQLVKRYGQVIGFASNDIAAGEHVHLHNLCMEDFDRALEEAAEKRTPAQPAALAPGARSDTFMGIRRADGRVATRNFIGILTTVNCSATVARAIESHFQSRIEEQFPNVDGVVALTQNFGCGIGAKTETMATLRRTLTGYAKHPNFAAVLVVGLGCESNQIADLFQFSGMQENDRLRSMTIQGAGGTQKAIKEGIALIEQMLPAANQVERTPANVSEIILALECGGSDSYSGISANPALGYAVDRIVAQGGTAILSETSEIYGAEHLLTHRAVSKEVGDKLIKRIEWWEDYCSRTGSEMNNNPSAGNKAGGLTTILEKSLGGIAKAGTTPLVDVYEYAEPVLAKGLVFMDTPGYDPMAVTGQVAGGANLLCFTTGRGSAFGCKPVPSMKLCSNDALWQRQEEDIDVNCGGIVSGTESLEEVGERIYQQILRMASGEKTKSENFGYGNLEFVPWIKGAIM